MIIVTPKIDSPADEVKYKPHKFKKDCDYLCLQVRGEGSRLRLLVVNDDREFKDLPAELFRFVRLPTDSPSQKNGAEPLYAALEKPDKNANEFAKASMCIVPPISPKAKTPQPKKLGRPPGSSAKSKK